MRIIRELIEFKPNSNLTNIGDVVQHFNNLVKKRAIAFLISDFIGQNLEKALKITAKKHDLIALRIYDQREKELPNMGLTLFEDGESGKRRWINTSKKRVRETYYNNSLSREHNILEIFKKSKVDHANICIQTGYIQPLMNLYKKL